MKKIFFVFYLSRLLLFYPQVAFGEERLPLRIISLTPATTEILFALGLNEEIVGVSSFCNYPKGALSKEKVGTFSDANIEKILFLKPTIVFCTGLEQTPIVTVLKQLKVKIYVCDPATIEELFTSISDIGRLTGKNDQAQMLIQTMRNTINEISLRASVIPQTKRPKVFVEVWYDPLMSAGSGSFVDELITLAGGVNISHDMPRPYGYFSAEQVLKRDPDIIFLTYMTKEKPAAFMEARLGWGGIRAVRNKHIYNDIDPDILMRPGPRLVEGLKEIQKRLP